ncbi:putative FHY3/FAR1 family protein [Rosa chinensis]|uniref:Putative FHY3/FAR1 family protein n=1 Tax=Rosa chinensis TaxID=74649 RepID=A0A2P6P948_ROSCH|nr:putative FHY3/FAR1 family protein [Rosa chinensis]
MIMPNMGHIIASCYNVVLIHLSSVQCFTFVPLGTLPLSLSSPREIAVGFLNGHFVQLLLKPGHPMPPIARDWEEYHKCEQSFTLHDSVRLPLTPGHLMPPIARDWERCCKREQRFIEEWTTLYSARVDHFKALQPEVFLKIDT